MFESEFWSSAPFTALVIIAVVLSTFLISNYFEGVEVKEQVGKHVAGETAAPLAKSPIHPHLDRRDLQGKGNPRGTH
jgi:hypothetical protein